MLTDVISLWEDLRRECQATGQTLERLVRPDSDVEIVLYKGPDDCSLVISPGFSSDWYKSVRTPTCIVCSPATARGPGPLAINLRDKSFEGIFVWFSQDIANRLYDCKVDDAPEVLAHGLTEWAEAFKVLPDSGMSRQAQQGLFAELLFLETVLIDRDLGKGILSWNSQNSVHDFQIGSNAWEVKSFGGRRQEVRISSEDQLDTIGLDSLFLVAVGLKVSETAGTTVMEIVDRLMCRLEDKTDLQLHFRTGLAKYGFIDESSIHQTFYFTPKSLAQYCVEDDFPRIVGSDIPSAVHNVKYALSLASLEHHVAEPIVIFRTD